MHGWQVCTCMDGRCAHAWTAGVHMHGCQVCTCMDGWCTHVRGAAHSLTVIYTTSQPHAHTHTLQLHTPSSNSKNLAVICMCVHTPGSQIRTHIPDCPTHPAVIYGIHLVVACAQQLHVTYLTLIHPHRPPSHNIQTYIQSKHAIKCSKVLKFLLICVLLMTDVHV